MVSCNVDSVNWVPSIWSCAKKGAVIYNLQKLTAILIENYLTAILITVVSYNDENLNLNCAVEKNIL